MRIAFALLVAGLVACGGDAAPTDAKGKPGAEGDAPACDFSLDKLGGKSFVRTVKGDGSDADLLARVKFVEEGGKTKAKYTARSLSDVYTYSCSKKDAELTCWEEAIKTPEFCRALVANGKECTAEAIAQLTGGKAEDLKAKVDETLKNIKGLSGPDRARMKEVYSAPTTPLRGVLRVRMKKDQCKLSVTDVYQAMTDGQLREIENVVGTATFVPTEKPLAFEHCSDGRSIAILENPDVKSNVTLDSVKVGQNFTVRYLGDAHAKPAPGCTYAMETYAGYERVAAAAPIQPDASGKLPWMFQAAITTKGNQVVHMYRYKTCGDAPQELIDVQCQATMVK